MRCGRARCNLAIAFAQSRDGGKRSPKATRPFSIRLSDAERYQLKREAGSQPLGAYVRARLLDGASRRQAGNAAPDAKLLGQALGKLGRLQLAGSLSDLAMAARVGAIAITPELEHDLRTACREVREIRDLLMRAMGFRPEAST